jgi:hypothetical protein
VKTIRIIRGEILGRRPIDYIFPRLVRELLDVSILWITVSQKVNSGEMQELTVWVRVPVNQSETMGPKSLVMTYWAELAVKIVRARKDRQACGTKRRVNKNIIESTTGSVIIRMALTGKCRICKNRCGSSYNTQNISIRFSEDDADALIAMQSTSRW